MRCRYCGKETNKEYCSFECRKAFFDHFDDEDKYKSRRKPLLIGSIIISIPFIVLFCGAGVTLMFTLMGITVITHPFPSSDLMKRTTPKDAIRRTIINGAVLIVIGLPFLLLTYTPFF